VSAIEKSMIVIKNLLDLEKQRNEVFRKDPLYSRLEIPIPINVGKINGGKWPSSVADVVTLEGRFGISPWETIQAAKAKLTQALKEIDDPFLKDHPVTLEFFGAHWLPGGVESSDPLLGQLTKSFAEMTGKEPVLEGAPWGTDGGYLTNVGIPMVIYGPGTTSVAHQVDEYVELDKIYECAEVLAKTIIEWCK
jgi:acetylornithine deacetylase